ncbi:hypothetical protein [Streptomyces sp. bgisy031]|uniref:hypothetical protein n=1 Tax=Streptomyces sp. bgisy031 TaxID=3413772 RepID=UPI003D73E377
MDGRVLALAAALLGFLHGLLECGHEVDDGSGRGFRLGCVGQLLAALLGDDQVGARIRVPVDRRVFGDVVARHDVHER